MILVENGRVLVVINIYKYLIVIAAFSGSHIVLDSGLIGPLG